MYLCVGCDEVECRHMQVKLAALCEFADARSQTDQLLSSYVGGSTHQ